MLGEKQPQTETAGWPGGGSPNADDGDVAYWPRQAPKEPPHSPPVSRRDALCGQLLGGRFRVEELLAQGGMGRVYRALQVPLRRQVALKVLSPSCPPSRLPDFHRRFLLEASIQARLRHPHNVTLYDFGRHPPNVFYLAMEYLTGVSLRLALLREHAFVPPRAVHIAICIARALEEAHGLGALHRDLKPANVFLERRPGDPDFVKLLDFGLVKSLSAQKGITQPGRAIGSPGYMAPEQIRGVAGGPTSDIYAVGVMLYEMLAGQPPFIRTHVHELMAAHVNDPPPDICHAHPRRQVPRGLAQVVARCLAKDPATRPPSMPDLLAALAPWSGWDDTIAEPPGAAPGDDRGGWDWDPAPCSAGWSVVSTTGILARPPPATPRTRELPTQIWPPPSAAATSRPATPGRRASPAAAALPTDCAPPPRRPPRQWARLGGAAFAAAVAGMLAVGAAAASLLHRARWASPRQLTLVTLPAGAAAFVNGVEACAATPCRLAWPPASVGPQQSGADPGNKGGLNVRFVLPGHHEHIIGRPARGRHLAIRAQLQPGPEAAP